MSFNRDDKLRAVTRRLTVRPLRVFQFRVESDLNENTWCPVFCDEELTQLFVRSMGALHVRFSGSERSVAIGEIEMTARIAWRETGQKPFLVRTCGSGVTITPATPEELAAFFSVRSTRRVYERVQTLRGR